MATDTELAELRERVARLEAEEAIKETVQTYNRAYDAQDIELLQSVFADDAVADVSPWGVYEGIEEINALYESIWEDMPFLMHHTTNQVIDVDGDEAVVTSYYHVMIETADDRRMHCGGYYRRHLERRDGDWLHVYHVVEIEYLHPVDVPSFRTVADVDEPRPYPQDNPNFPLPLFPDR